MGDGGAPGLFRYLAGDLRGGSARRRRFPSTRAPGTHGQIQYPLAPEFLADCDRRRSGSTRSSSTRSTPGVAIPVGRPLPRGRRGPDAVDAPDGGGSGAEGEDAEAGQERAAASLREHPPRRGVPVAPGEGVRGGLFPGGGGIQRGGGGGGTLVETVERRSGGVPRRDHYKETRFYLRRVFLNLLHITGFTGRRCSPGTFPRSRRREESSRCRAAPTARGAGRQRSFAAAHARSRPDRTAAAATARRKAGGPGLRASRSIVSACSFFPRHTSTTSHPAVTARTAASPMP